MQIEDIIEEHSSGSHRSEKLKTMRNTDTIKQRTGRLIFKILYFEYVRQDTELQ